VPPVDSLDLLEDIMLVEIKRLTTAQRGIWLGCIYKRNTWCINLSIEDLLCSRTCRDAREYNTEQFQYCHDFTNPVQVKITNEGGNRMENMAKMLGKYEGSLTA
jgi:hypothetical protein